MVRSRHVGAGNRTRVLLTTEQSFRTPKDDLEWVFLTEMIKRWAHKLAQAYKAPICVIHKARLQVAVFFQEHVEEYAYSI